MFAEYRKEFMANKEVTIYDIAKQLKLSASTVSRALNENKLINENTRNRVIAYAEGIGYQTNTFASNLRSQSTKTIGVIVPKLDSKFISSCLAGAEKVAAEKGYNLLISQTLEDFEKEKKDAKALFKKRVDGLLISLSRNSETLTHLKPFFDKGIPVLFFDRTPEGTTYSSYLIDNFEAAYKATKHLIDNGCKELTHITLKSCLSVFSQRERGFKQAIADANLSSLGQVIHLDQLNLKSGKEVAGRITLASTDGVFCANDQAAMGCMSELLKRGIRIPGDIAFVGFNNEPFCDLISPSLTTVNYPAFEMGTLVTNHLVEHILGNSNINLTNKTLLKSELVIRESSLKTRNNE